MAVKPEKREMWLVNLNRPWAMARRVLVDVYVGPKRIWGVTHFVAGNRKDTRQYTYGVNMFGTEEAALRECYARMKVFAADWYNQKFFYDAVIRCEVALAQRRSA